MTINLRSTKFARLTTTGVMLLVLACGAITIRIDTEVRDETEIKHNIEMEASGPVAMLVAEEWDPNEFDDFDGHCNAHINVSEDEWWTMIRDIVLEMNQPRAGILITKSPYGIHRLTEMEAVHFGDVEPPEDIDIPVLGFVKPTA